MESYTQIINLSINILKMKYIIKNNVIGKKFKYTHYYLPRPQEGNKNGKERIGFYNLQR